tara:strand:+ start:2096 stop:3178 length:1083 start_codon:yes stop_codon:yes gene_type:complete
MGVAKDCLKIVVTSAVALTAGLICESVGVPAPYLMGSLFGVWVVGGSLPAVQPYLGIARWFHVPVVMGLSVLIGTSFNPELIAHINGWAATLGVMLVTTAIATIVGMFWLVRIRHYPITEAFLSSVPGGQAEILMIAREHTEKDYVVALFHLVRVVLVFCSTPLLLAVTQGHLAVAQSNFVLHQMPTFLSLPLWVLSMFLMTALAGYLIARLLHMPMPHLLGPLCLSIVLHVTGALDIPRISEFVILAQVAIGGAIGARLAQVQFRELYSYIADAVVSAVIMLVVYAISALFLNALFGLDLLKLWLAFVPGGLYEVTLLALLFGFDVAFVAVHHTIRIVFIILSLPVLIPTLKRLIRPNG